MDKAFKTGALVKFPDSGYFATIVKVATEYGCTNVTLAIFGDYTGPNQTNMSIDMLKRRAVVYAEAPVESR